MMLAKLLRQPSLFTHNAAAMQAIRGGKKKKGGAIEAPTIKDIVNIFKDRQDPLVYPSDSYPPYVMELIDEKYLPNDVMFHMIRGERMPTTSEQWTLARNIRRTLIKDANRMRKDALVYESDEDFAEYLGEQDDNEELDEEAAGEVSKPKDEDADE